MPKDYLPLTGGAMTGNIHTSNSQFIDIGYNYGDSNGGLISLRSKNYTNNPGGFELFARNESNTITLFGDTSGILQWGGKNIVRSVNGAVAGTDGNVTLYTIPTGTIISFAGTSIPDGYLLCNGAAVSRTIYANLFTAIGTIYGAGDGSTTFNLPNLDKRFIEYVTSMSEVGTYVEAGLPDITAHSAMGGFSGQADFPLGAIYHTTLNKNTTLASAYQSGADLVTFEFDAAKADSMYGSSTTNQPKSLRMLPCIKF